MNKGSPKGLALEVPSAGAVLFGSLSLSVPRQQRHQVVGGSIAALSLYRFGGAHWEEQD